MRYLYQPGELEGGTKRATDPIWSLKVHQIERNVTKPNEPVVYYLSDGPKRGFLREEMLVVPPNTQQHHLNKGSVYVSMAANQDIQFVPAPVICSWRELTVDGVYEVLFVEDRGLDKYNKPSYILEVCRVDTGYKFSFYAPASLAFVLKRRTSMR